MTPQSSVSYLLDLGLLDPASLVRHGLRVEEVAGRNRNFRVLSAPHSYFLKQAPRRESGADVTLAVEAALYDWIAAEPGAEKLRPLLPRRQHWDPERSILVLDLIPDAAPTVPAHEASVVGNSLRRLVATALAECHRLPVDPDSALGARLPRAAPWVFDLARPAPASLRELAPAQLSVIQALQSAPEAVAALDQLRDAWRPARLIHGDVKWNNVLVRLDGAGIPAGVLLVDWEMAQLGDPAWDVGAVLHSFIIEAVLELEPARGAGAEGAAQLLGTAAGRLHSAHRDFWGRYVAAARLPEAEAEALLDRVPAHVAARLVKTAYEWSQAETRVPRRAAAILQLGINMLLSPRAAGEVVLGLGASAPARA